MQMLKKCTFKLLKNWERARSARKLLVRNKRKQGVVDQTLEFMREKMEKDLKMKQEERPERQSEQQKITEQQNSMLQQILQEQMQDLSTAFMQQSQQQSQTMLAIVDKFTKK